MLFLSFNVACPKWLVPTLVAGVKQFMCSFPSTKDALVKSFGAGRTSYVLDLRSAKDSLLRNKLVGDLPDFCGAFDKLKVLSLHGLPKMNKFTMPAWLSKCKNLETLWFNEVNIVGKMVSTSA